VGVAVAILLEGLRYVKRFNLKIEVFLQSLHNIIAIISYNTFQYIEISQENH
jgi:hypothetical protein